MNKLWSHHAAQRLAQIPRDSPEWHDLQEALSLRWSAKSLIVLPLASGHLAIFKRDFQCLAILEGMPTIEEWQQMSQESYEELKAKVKSLDQRAQSASAIAGGVKSTTMKPEDLF